MENIDCLVRRQILLEVLGLKYSCLELGKGVRMIDWESSLLAKAWLAIVKLDVDVRIGFWTVDTFHCTLMK